MELPDGIRRITCPLPTRPGHVHAYLLPGEEGWTLVDTGIGLPDASERWSAELEGIEVVRILVTHFHPDHIGAAADVAAVTGAPVYEGELDYAQARMVWGNPEWPQRIADWFLTHGVPRPIAEELIESGSVYAPFIRYQPDPALVSHGEHLDGWELVDAPGHADGQLCLLKDGVLISADHLLGRISPTVGLWPESRPDPLGDYIRSLERTIELAPRLALPGHGEPIVDPVGRAHALIEHHRERLGVAEASLTATPRTGYDLSFELFGADLKAASRRFAVAETLSHLERLVREERAVRHEDDGAVAYTARQLGRRASA
ncbi:MAG: MBL fold metallo-hydrolase [Gaiellaceae bacterium MAG52_C11]|nr:MBL fold metallo-hydrolase [Candidatus Gaiellasilicea maunaloa]